MRRAAGLLALVALCGCPPGDAPSPGRARSAGPLVGAVTSSTAKLWIYPGPGDGPPALRLRVEGAEAWDTVTPQEAAGGAWRVDLQGLQPGVRYEYGFRRGEDAPASWRGGWRSAPPAGEPGRLHLALASCAHQRKDRVQPAWTRLLGEDPDLLLLLGDNVYANSTDPDALWEAHLQERQISSFAEVVRQVPTLAIWDDHDFGPNDAAGDEPGKAGSLRAFGELFANPAAGTPETPGIFFRHAWGDVELFCLDVRYHRSPLDAPDGPGKVVLGEGQRAWLRESLASSQATFKLVASGSAFVEEPGKRDTWASYPQARTAFYELLREVGGGGVILLSGDLHRSGLEVHPPEETGLAYPLYEVVSSGIAHSAEQSFVTLLVDTATDTPRVQVSVIHGDGTRALERTLLRTELE